MDDTETLAPSPRSSSIPRPDTASSVESHHARPRPAPIATGRPKTSPDRSSRPPQQASHRKIGEWYLYPKTLGSGSMGKVKLGMNAAGDRVAIKIIRRNSEQHELAVKAARSEEEQPSDKARIQAYEKDRSKEIRTLREASMCMLLHHPYICGMREISSTASHHYMVAEYVNGGQMLDYIISHGKLKEKAARKFARQICSALEYCHANSVVHRDLKIENILISKTGNIKIIDFGLSNLYSPRSELGTFCGSLYFAAPELLRARKYRGPEVDIWSFGVVLYVLVCGKVPFDDQSMPALHAKIKRGHVEYPHILSAECKHILSRILVTEPSLRATLPEILSHPWMTKDYDGPPASHLSLREPLRAADIDPEVIKHMEGFEFGSPERIEADLRQVLESEEYLAAVKAYYKRRGSSAESFIFNKEESASTPPPTPPPKKSSSSSKRFSGLDFYRKKVVSAFSSSTSSTSTATKTLPDDAILDPSRINGHTHHTTIIPHNHNNHNPNELSNQQQQRFSASSSSSMLSTPPPDPTRGYDPLISIYFLVREKIDRDRIYGPGVFASSTLSVAGPPPPIVPSQVHTSPIYSPSEHQQQQQQSFDGHNRASHPLPVAHDRTRVKQQQQLSARPKTSADPWNSNKHSNNRHNLQNLHYSVGQQAPSPSNVQSSPSPVQKRPATAYGAGQGPSIPPRSLNGASPVNINSPQYSPQQDQYQQQGGVPTSAPDSGRLGGGFFSPPTTPSKTAPYSATMPRSSHQRPMTSAGDGSNGFVKRFGSLLGRASSVSEGSEKARWRPRSTYGGSPLGAAAEPPITHNTTTKNRASSASSSSPLKAFSVAPKPSLSHVAKMTNGNHHQNNNNNGGEVENVVNGDGQDDDGDAKETIDDAAESPKQRLKNSNNVNENDHLLSSSNSNNVRPKTASQAGSPTVFRTPRQSMMNNENDDDHLFSPLQDVGFLGRSPSPTGSREETFKPIYLKGIFSVATTSTKSYTTIREDLTRVFGQLGIKYRPIQRGFECVHVPSIDLASLDSPHMGQRNVPINNNSTVMNSVNGGSPTGGSIRRQSSLHRRVSKRFHRGGGDDRELGSQSTLAREAISNSSFAVSTTEDPTSSSVAHTPTQQQHSQQQQGSGGNAKQRPPDRLIIRFEVYIVKVPWLPGLQGLQFRRLQGDAFQVGELCRTILKQLKL